MRPNKITELNLELHVRDLLEQDKSEREIASILSGESNQKITQSSVHRYLASQDKMRAEVIAKREELKAKVVGAELDTVTARLEVIQEIRDLATQARESGELSTALAGLSKAILALDSLDKRLGRFTTDQPQQEVHVNLQLNQEYTELKSLVLGGLCDNCKQRLKGGLYELTSK
jgi:hypothetical protein